MSLPLQKTKSLTGNYVVDINESGTIFYLGVPVLHPPTTTVNNIIQLPDTFKMNDGLYFSFVAAMDQYPVVNWYIASDAGIYGTLFNSSVSVRANAATRIHMSGGLQAGEGITLNAFDRKWFLAPGSASSNVMFTR